MPDTAVHIMMALAHALPEQRVVGRAAIVALELHGFNRAAPPEYRPIDGTCGVVLIWTR